jgi:hypothetical protein
MWLLVKRDKTQGYNNYVWQVKWLNVKAKKKSVPIFYIEVHHGWGHTQNFHFQSFVEDEIGLKSSQETLE